MTNSVLLGLSRDPFREPEVIWGTAGLALALLAGAFVVWLVDRWRKKNEAGIDPARELTDFREMFERGEITEDEYARLRERVARRVKAPPRPDEPSPPPTPADPAKDSIPPPASGSSTASAEPTEPRDPTPPA